MKARRVLHVATGPEPLAIREYGAGPALVLVHGLCGSENWWRRNLATLARHFTVSVLELRGYGRNRALLPARIDAAAEAVAGYIAGLPGGRAHLLGHSMGGQIAIHLAARFPERVDRLVLVSATGLLRGTVAAMALRLPVEALELAPSFAPTLARDALRAGPLNLLASALELLGDDVSGLAPRIAAPTLLLWGENDRLVPPALGEALRAILPGARLEVLPDAGHVVFWDRPERFNPLVISFLTPPSPLQPEGMS